MNERKREGRKKGTTTTTKQQNNNTCLKVIFQDNLGKPVPASTRTSPFQILLELRMIKMTKLTMTAGAIRCAKFQSNHHHQQTNTQLLTGQIPFLLSNRQCQSTEWKRKSKEGKKQTIKRERKTVVTDCSLLTLRGQSRGSSPGNSLGYSCRE